jgi:tRNA (adenine22-N1)-methyltransferase
MTQQNTTNVVRRLDLRLAHLQAEILAQVQQGAVYSDIWDLCCDHGRLGLHLHQQPVLAQTQLHLIDCVPSIIEQLQLVHGAHLDARLRFVCIDAAQIVLPQQGNQALVIAGVGGDTCISILQALLAQITLMSPSTSRQFFTDVYLSPNSGCYELRQFLARHNAHLMSEDFISAKGFHHEHIVVRFARQQPKLEQPASTGQTAISPTGIRLWRPFTRAKKIYLQKLLGHHQQVNAYRPELWRSQAIVDYQLLIAELTEA